MNQDISQLITETQRLREANKDLETSLLKLQQAFDKITQGVSKSSKAYQDGLSVLNKIENGLKNTNEQLEKQSRALEQVSNSAAKSSADLSTLAAQQDNLKKAQQSHGDEVLKLQVSFKALGETIDEQSGKAKEQADGFDYFGKTFEAIDSSLKDLKDSAGAFAPQLESVMSGFNALKTGLDVAKDGFSGVGAALKATGFGLLMLVLQSITEYFSTDKIGIRKFQSILAGLSVVIEKIKNAFSSLGKSIVDAVLHPGDTAKKLWNGFVENIGNRFKAFGVILNGVMDLNPKKIADGVLQLSTGVTNATDKIKAAYKTVKDEAVNTWTAVEAAARKTYKQLSVDAGNNQSGNPKKIKHKAGKRAEKITREPQLEQVIHKSVSRIDAEKKAFDEELTLLEDQLNKKLITQEEYYKKAAELNKKYKQGILTALQDTTPAAMSEHFKDESEKARLKAAIANDEKNTKSVLPWKKNQAEKKLIEDKYAYEILQAKGNADKIKELESQKLADLNELNKRYEQQKKEFALNTAQQVADKAFSIIGNNIKAGSDAKIKSLEKDKAAELSNKNLTQSQRKAIEDKYQKKENQEKVKAFKAEQKVQIAQAVINGAVGVQKTIAEWGMPFAIPFMIPVVAQTATQIATIASQKPPAYAKGGQFVSDGRGALLPGYSRTDNTNAYLRSGEAVVVSEAMRNPWARNLVSAINVAHGGRDFSVPNTTRGYAIGGIFTDGGNANRYYNQPVNDAKELANSLAYQMINNFPPIYVDVKDVNNQQGILAQTVNRVNL